MENSNLQEKYRYEYVFNFWDRIRLWFLVRKVYRQKKTVLWEANLDRLYYESQYPNILGYDDTADRKALMEENQKPAGNKNEKRVEYLENQISKAKAVKKSYRENLEFIGEVKNYLKMLELWMSSENQN